MDQVILLSLTASLNPTLVAATTVMLLLESPAKLMAGYLLGAYITTITLGLLIVFSLFNSSAANTTENTLSPAVDIGLGAVALAIAFVLYTGRAQRVRERRGARMAEKPDTGPPRWQRELSKGSPRVTFVVGALRTLAGASYLAGRESDPQAALLDDGHGAAGGRLQPGDDVAARGSPSQFLIAPRWTPQAIDRVKLWVRRRCVRVDVPAIVVSLSSRSRSSPPRPTRCKRRAPEPANPRAESASRSILAV